jgi:hypothetical protein
MYRAKRLVHYENQEEASEAHANLPALEDANKQEDDTQQCYQDHVPD